MEASVFFMGMSILLALGWAYTLHKAVQWREDAETLARVRRNVDELIREYEEDENDGADVVQGE